MTEDFRDIDVIELAEDQIKSFERPSAKVSIELISRLKKANSELQMRREVEQLIVEIPKGKIKSANFRFTKGKNGKGKYVISLKVKESKFQDYKYINHGPFTLPELHAKLLELKGE